MSTVVVHDLAQACAALAAAAEAGVTVTLRSAPGAAGSLGAPLFLAMVEAARAAVPEAPAPAVVVDCGDAAGHTLAALRAGAPSVRVNLREPALSRVAHIAARRGAIVDVGGGPVLDLRDRPDPLAACREWLEKAADSL